MEGVLVGHTTDLEAATGCTVFLFEGETRAVASIRGGAPGSREMGTLAPGNLVEGVNAVVWSGGSAPGLATCDGVSAYLQEKGEGFPTASGPVPIVAGAVLYDLEVGNAVSPTAEWGYRSCLAVTDKPAQGTVGAGSGAVVGKYRGMDKAVKGGFGHARSCWRRKEVDFFVVTNPLGDVYHPVSGALLAGSRHRGGVRGFFDGFLSQSSLSFHTTLTVGVFHFFLSREELSALTGVVHSALASCIRPFGTLYDGDTVVLVSRGHGHCSYFSQLRLLYQAVGQAVLNSVDYATAIGGIPSRSDIIQQVSG